jgi:hypothetical protein
MDPERQPLHRCVVSATDLLVLRLDGNAFFNLSGRVPARHARGVLNWVFYGCALLSIIFGLFAMRYSGGEIKIFAGSKLGFRDFPVSAATFVYSGITIAALTYLLKKADSTRAERPTVKLPLPDAAGPVVALTKTYERLGIRAGQVGVVESRGSEQSTVRFFAPTLTLVATCAVANDALLELRLTQKALLRL